MADAPFDVREAHQWFAKELNNLAWDLLEQKTRTEEQTERMIHAAHASCWHWLQVGTPLNRQRAECLLATAYTTAGRPESAVHHAERCLSLSRHHGEGQTLFDRATAHGCASAASVLAGRSADAHAHYERARQFAAELEPDDARAFFHLYPEPPG